jgi:hypothetical protein
MAVDRISASNTQATAVGSKGETLDQCWQTIAELSHAFLMQCVDVGPTLFPPGLLKTIVTMQSVQ